MVSAKSRRAGLKSTVVLASAQSRFRGMLSLLAASSLLASASAGAAPAIRLEAEDAQLVGPRAASEPAGHSGSGYATGFLDDADRVAFVFDASAGVHALTIGYRSPEGEKGYAGAVNGVGFSGKFEGAPEFRPLEIGPVLLKEGANEIWIGGGWNRYEIDYIEIAPSEPFAPPLPLDPTPVAARATSEARALLKYLADNYGKSALSGQQDVEELDIVEKLAGKRPAIVGGDLMDYTPSRIARGGDPSGHTESLIERHRAGMIVTVSWHWGAPRELVETPEFPWYRGFYTKGTTFDIAAALADKDGEAFGLLMRDIDAVAVELKKLRDANVPVLWRPLHEADGAWFWWGARGKEPLIELWRILFDRLTNHHDLRNLIWVQTIERLDWYAGDEYVDILGIDAYPPDPDDTLATIWGRFLGRFDGRKIVALSEFGKVPDVPSMFQVGVRFSYFMSWNGEFGARGMEDKEKLAAIYGSPEVVTLDELLESGIERASRELLSR